MAADRPFRFGVVSAQAGSGAQWAQRARQLESMGFSTLLVPDTLGATVAPMPALMAAAAATTTLRVGTYVLANDLRHPVLVAREAAAVDLLSGGRFELGLGAGRPGAEADHRKLGIPWESGGVRVCRLGESLQIIRGVLGREPVTLAGRHYQVDRADVFPVPVQRPRPPLLVAGAGDRLLELAAREADIVAIGARPPMGDAEVGERVEHVRRAAGDRFARLELNLNLLAAGERPDPSLLTWGGLDLDELVRTRSPFVAVGTVDQMRDQLLARREALGVSYLTIGDRFADALAPVVERLAGA